MTETQTVNVRLVRSDRVHAVYAAERSGIMHRALVPSCGVSVGQPSARRVATTDAVNCPDCLSH